MIEAAFPRRPGAPPLHWVLRNAILTGPEGTCDLGAVQNVTLRVSRADGTVYRDLILSHPNGTWQVTCAGLQGEPQPAFERLLSAVVAALPPSVPAQLEQGRLPDWPKHLLGWFALIVAVALGWRAAAIGLTGDRMALVAAPMLILAAIGVTLILSYRPRPRLSMPVPVNQLPIASKTL